MDIGVPSFVRLVGYTTVMIWLYLDCACFVLWNAATERTSCCCVCTPLRTHCYVTVFNEPHDEKRTAMIHLEIFCVLSSSGMYILFFVYSLFFHSSCAGEGFDDENLEGPHAIGFPGQTEHRTPRAQKQNR